MTDTAFLRRDPGWWCEELSTAIAKQLTTTRYRSVIGIPATALWYVVDHNQPAGDLTSCSISVGGCAHGERIVSRCLTGLVTTLPVLSLVGRPSNREDAKPLAGFLVL